MNPRLTTRRHGRAIAAVGALVAVSATTTLALVVGSAAAAPAATQPGKCIDNVNVRSEPSTASKIVAVCPAGRAVKVDQQKDGFVHLADLKGWAAREYVSVNGKTLPAPAPRATGSPTTTAPAAGANRTPHERHTPVTSSNDRGPSGSSSPSGSGGSGNQPTGSGTPTQGGANPGTGGQAGPAPTGIDHLLG